MAKIDIYPDEMGSLSHRLKKISSVIKDAENIARRVQSNLDFQVSAKEGIASDLRSVTGKLGSHYNKVSELARLTTLSNEEFRIADGQMDKKACNIFNRISTPVAGLIQKLANFFAKVEMERYVQAATIFLSTGSIIGAVGLTEMIYRLKKVTGKTPGGGTAPATTPQPGAVDAPASGGNVSSKPYENLVSFPNDAYSGKANGNYSDYSIVGGMKPEYCFSQKDSAYNPPENNWFATSGCLAVADACVGSIVLGSKLNPVTEWKGSGKYTTRVGLNTKDDSYLWTPEQIRAKAYEELKAGRPVTIGVCTESNKDTHTVVIVGLRNGANTDHLTDADFLIMDPGDGKIKALSERKRIESADTCIRPRALEGERANSGIRRVK